MSYNKHSVNVSTFFSWQHLLFLDLFITWLITFCVDTNYKAPYYCSCQKQKNPFQPLNFKEVFMPFSQSVYMTVVVLNGDTVRARGREGWLLWWRQNQFPDRRSKNNFLSARHSRLTDGCTNRPSVCVCVFCVCVCMWGGGGFYLLPSKRFSSFWHNVREPLTTCVFQGKIYAYFTKTFGLYQLTL